MKLYNLKYIGLALAISLSSTFTIATQFDQDYETAFSQRSVLNLVQYVQQLSTLALTDTALEKAKKCEALKYFFATGGKDGFSETPATASETAILTQALAVTTALHYTLEKTRNTVLDLVQINRKSRKLLDDHTK